jgi:hypothetical protein
MAMPDDKLTAALDEIRSHHQQHVSVNFPAPGICISRDGSWPCEAGRLLAALDEVLDTHLLSIAADGEEVCTRCGWEAGKRVPAGKCLIREAISRELLGKESGNDERHLA